MIREAKHRSQLIREEKSIAASKPSMDIAMKKLEPFKNRFLIPDTLTAQSTPEELLTHLKKFDQIDTEIIVMLIAEAHFPADKVLETFWEERISRNWHYFLKDAAPSILGNHDAANFLIDRAAQSGGIDSIAKMAQYLPNDPVIAKKVWDALTIPAVAGRHNRDRYRAMDENVGNALHDGAEGFLKRGITAKTFLDATEGIENAVTQDTLQALLEQYNVEASRLLSFVEAAKTKDFIVLGPQMAMLHPNGREAGKKWFIQQIREKRIADEALYPTLFPDSANTLTKISDVISTKELFDIAKEALTFSPVFVDQRLMDHLIKEGIPSQEIVQLLLDTNQSQSAEQFFPLRKVQ